MKISAVVLLAGATAALASQAEPASTHQLEARDPTFGLINGLLGGLLGGGGHSSVRYPSRNWKCSGRGNDGWQYDCYGNSRPAHIPYGWAWFGVEIGWAPTAHWSCSSHFEFSAEFLSKAHLVTWWTPSTAWKKHNIGIDLGVSIPGFWGLIPARGWKCNGSGRDGFSLDFNGHGRPGWAPSGWLWFGESIGWGPPAGFDVSIGFDLPSAFIPKAHLCTWWAPSTAWVRHNAGFDFGVGVTVPSWGWGLRPSADWKCNGSGKDGWSIDHLGHGRPSWVPAEGWFWFGIEIGWQPSASWNCGSSWTPPTHWESECGKATWWTPPTPWVSKHRGHKWHFGFRPPKHWGCEVPSTPSLPPVHVTTTTTVAKPSTTSKKPHTTTHKVTTSTKPHTTTSVKPKTTTSVAHHHTTTAKPKPSSPGTVTVTKTITKTVGVPTPSGGGGGCCKCEEEQPRLARRSKSRQLSH